MKQNPTRTCAVLVDLPDIVVLRADRDGPMLQVHVETGATSVGCPDCGVVAQVKERVVVKYCDLPVYGVASTLFWHKRRWRCSDRDCSKKTWTEEDRRIAAPRMAITDRAGRWATRAVGEAGRSVNDVAGTLGCDSHTVNDAVLAYGTALIEHPERFGTVSALGLDETGFVRLAPYYRTSFITSIVDVGQGQLLDIVEGRGGQGSKEWLKNRDPASKAAVTHGTLDLSSAYKAVFTAELPDATLVADPFHVVKLATSKLDETRRRVQNETLGHRGHKDDPLYRCRRLLTKAEERLSEDGRSKLLNLLEAGDPKGDVATAWHAKEAVRELYSHQDQELAITWLDELAADLSDKIRPPEVRSLGRTLKRWRLEITAWHACHFTNGPTEAMNNLIKRIKRVAFGFTSFRNYRTRSLLYAGKPNWSLLETIRPR